MITEDYISFEIAKLLKEKGFNEKFHMYYIEDGKYMCDNLHDIKDYAKSIVQFDYLHRTKVPAPTLQMAMKWLREVHKININILYDAQRFVKTDGTTEDVYVYEVDIITKNGSIYIGNYNYYESACEAAIKYCLINLI